MIDINVEELVTELSMTYSFKMHLIVEGDDDRLFFKSALKGLKNVNLLCVWGSDNVMHVIREVDKIKAVSEFLPTLGIVDIDYRIPLGTLLQSPNLITSDDRDLECMMFNSASFETVLAEFGSDKKIAALGGAGYVSSAAQSAAVIVGRLRFHTQQTQSGTSFQNLELAKVVNRKTLAIDPNVLVNHINARQRVAGRTLSDNAFELAKVTCSEARCGEGRPYFHHDLLLCRGHDLMEILAIGFKSLFGSRSATESSSENVERLFRLNYIAHFRATSMAKEIDKWLTENAVAPQVSLV